MEDRNAGRKEALLFLSHPDGEWPLHPSQWPRHSSEERRCGPARGCVRQTGARRVATEESAYAGALGLLLLMLR